MPIYRYRKDLDLNINITDLSKVLPDTVTAIGIASPQKYVDITVAATSKIDLDDTMLRFGYAFVEEAPATTVDGEARTSLDVPATSDAASSPHDLGSADHGADTLVNVNAKITDATLVDTADSRFSNDRAASGIRTATTIVVVSGATAPSIGQILKADSSIAASWQAGGVVLQTGSDEIIVDTTSTDTNFADLLTVNMTTGANFIIIDVTVSISTNGVNNDGQIRILVDGVSKGGAGEDLKTNGIASSLSIKKRIAVTAAAHVVKLQWKTSSNTIQCRPVTGAVDTEHASLIVQEVSG